MSLRFIYGAAGSGKSYQCLKEMKENLNSEEGRSLILLVPEQFSFGAEKNLITTLGEKAILKAQVLSFTRLGNKVLNEVGGITHQYINECGRAMLLYRIIDKTKNQLKIFTKAAKQQGFVNTISELITELKKHNVTPEMLKVVIENMQDEIIKYKIQDIYLIFSAFEALLHETYIDMDDTLNLVAEKIKKSTFLKGAEIWVDEFSSFTPQQYKVIEEILKVAKRVNVTLCTDCLNGNCAIEHTDVFAPIKGTEDRLLRIGMENNIKLEKPFELKDTISYRFKDREAIGYLERHFFSYPYKPYGKKSKDITLFKAVNTYTEIEKVSKEITRLCREENFRFRDIAVIGRDLNRYESLIQAIFSEYEIPYFIDRKREITSNPLLLLILSAMEIYTKNWSYEAVFRYLKTGLTNIEREEIDEIETYVLERGIKGQKWVEEEVWDASWNDGLEEKSISEEENEKIEKLKNTKTTLVEPLVRFHQRIEGKKTVKEICTFLFDFLQEIKVVERIERKIQDFEKNGELDLASEYGQIWNILLQLLDQMVEAMGEEIITLKDFVRVLNIGAAQYKIGLIPPALDQVLISSVERVKSHDVNVLFIIGVNDGVFPKGENEEGILSDRERERLKLQGIELAKDTKTRAFEEQFLVYRTLTIACKYLKISYPIADHEGKTLRASIIISRIKKLFPLLVEESNMVKVDTEVAELEEISRPIPTFNELVAIMRREKEGNEVKALWKDVYQWYGKDEEWSRKRQGALSALHYTNLTEKISKEKIKDLYGKPMNFSVSRLETYTACPFSYYVRFGLKAKERKVYKLTYPDLGTFMHKVLDEFSQLLKAEKMGWREVEKDWCTEAVTFIVNRMLEEKANYILNSSARYRYIAERIKKILIRAIWLIVEHIKRSGFEPVEYEVGFGNGGKIPAVSIELPSGETINLIGRIDRIDTMDKDGETYLRVIDYKSGNKSFKLSDIYYGLQMQLLMYLDAILSSSLEEGKEKSTIPGGMLYFHIDNPVIKGTGKLTEEEIEKEIMKKLKMKGLLLAEPEIIKEMDKEIEGNSLIIPARMNKDGSLGKSSAATKEQFDALRNHVRKKVVNLCEEMLEGNIEVKPYKKKDATPCTYCDYSSICQFDLTMDGNEYKIINEKSDEEVWSLIMGEGNPTEEKEKEVK